MTEAFAVLLRILALTERGWIAPLFAFVMPVNNLLRIGWQSAIRYTPNWLPYPLFVERNWLYLWLRLHPKFVPEPSF